MISLTIKSVFCLISTLYIFHGISNTSNFFLLTFSVHYFCFLRSPATSRIRAKMLYATSKDAFKRELDGFHYEIQATDPTEVDLEVLKDRAH